jgi:tetratricopeptide (TPR) repeat protein
VKANILYIFFIWVDCISSAVSIYSQTTVIDSLKKVLVHTREDSSRIEILLQLGKNYDNVDTGKARNYYREADSIAVQSGNEVLMGFTNELAGVLQTRYDQKKALQYYNTALNMLSKHQQSMRVKRTIASLNNNLGVIHYMNGDFEGALRYFMGAVKFYEENDPANVNRGFGYGNISTTFADLKKIDNAVVYSKKAIDFAEKANSKNLQMASFISHGNNLLKLKKYEESMPYLERAKALAEELKNKYNLYLYYSNIGEYHFNVADYKKAVQAYERALQFAREMDAPHEIGITLHAIGSCNIYLKNYPAAANNLEQAKKLSEANQLKDLEQYIYESLAELSEKKEDYKNALSYKNRFISLKDSTYAADNIKRIEFWMLNTRRRKKKGRSWACRMKSRSRP